ncbi:MAG: HDIG domain-containing protein [Sedimentisphaerales bacterium]|nr:HDIG domain-containing protein [Sedimentisphaerales bacterium]
MGLFRKASPRRTQVRRNIRIDRFSQVSRLINRDGLISLLICILFVVLTTPILSFDFNAQPLYRTLILTGILVVIISIAGLLYIHQFQKRLITNHARAAILAGLFVLLLTATKLTSLLFEHTCGATSSAVAMAIVLSLAYSQRFTMGMCVFFSILAVFAAGSPKPTQISGMDLLLTMSAGTVICCFSLREIRTRMKLLKVSAGAAAAICVMAATLNLLKEGARPQEVFSNAGYHAGTAFVIGLLIQSLLPLIEKTFRIATSMTLLDYSDANQPLLKRLAMEAPGTFSHSLMIGSISEAAAEAVGRNGLLCRVGAYYHDIGKLNKPGYFVENEMGSASRHKELSPAMSQLIIVGHVKDGIEMAKEYALPSVLHQFIDTHHGTTLIEHFYHQAKQQKAKNTKSKTPDTPAESEFRYPGPKPRTKEAAIVMLADTVEGAVRSLSEITPTKIEAVVHNMAMKRLQDGQFDVCELSLRELSQIEASISKTLAAHYHGRIAYPQRPDLPSGEKADSEKSDRKKD